jgi:hypothetical protein
MGSQSMDGNGRFDTDSESIDDKLLSKDFLKAF